MTERCAFRMTESDEMAFFPVRCPHDGWSHVTSDDLLAARDRFRKSHRLQPIGTTTTA
jgi:hypothetical protein